MDIVRAGPGGLSHIPAEDSVVVPRALAGLESAAVARRRRKSRPEGSPPLHSACSRQSKVDSRRSPQCNWDFHFAFPAATVYRRLPLPRSFSAFVPEPKNRARRGVCAMPWNASHERAARRMSSGGRTMPQLCQQRGLCRVPQGLDSETWECIMSGWPVTRPELAKSTSPEFRRLRPSDSLIVEAH
jgi:hypothetical protein